MSSMQHLPLHAQILVTYDLLESLLIYRGYVTLVLPFFRSNFNNAAEITIRTRAIPYRTATKTEQAVKR